MQTGTVHRSSLPMKCSTFTVTRNPDSNLAELRALYADDRLHVPPMVNNAALNRLETL